MTLITSENRQAEVRETIVKYIFIKNNCIKFI